MKKHLFLLLPFALSVFLFNNCKNKTNDEDNKTATESKLVSTISTSMDDVAISYTFSYNDQEQFNKIIYALEYESGYTQKYTWNITYKTNEITMVEVITEHQGDQNNTKKTTEYSVTLNNKKFATKIIESPVGKPEKNTTTLIFNALNYLTKLTLEDQLNHHSETSSLTYNYNFNVTWVSDNQTTVAETETSDNGQERLSNYTYEYGELSNKKANLDLNYMFGLLQYSSGSPDILPILSYYGERSKNLVSKSTVKRGSNSDDITNYTYEVDAEGYPINVMMGNDVVVTITYTK